MHTLWTFRGPRIRNINRYIEQAMVDYAVRAYELLFWQFAEQEQGLMVAGQQCVVRSEPIQLPPHHRF